MGNAHGWVGVVNEWVVGGGWLRGEKMKVLAAKGERERGMLTSRRFCFSLKTDFQGVILFLLAYYSAPHF